MRPATSLIGVSSGKSAVDLERLVGEAVRAALDHRFGQRAVGGEVEVGEQRLPAAHVRPFRGERLLDLEHHVARLPDVRGGRQELRAGGGVGRIRQAAAETGARLGEDFVTAATRRSAPAGVRATRFSWTLISRTTPTFTRALLDDGGALLGLRRRVRPPMEGEECSASRREKTLGTRARFP
jgi:hypothetical protein